MCTHVLWERCRKWNKNAFDSLQIVSSGLGIHVYCEIPLCSLHRHMQCPQTHGAFGRENQRKTLSLPYTNDNKIRRLGPQRSLKWVNVMKEIGKQSCDKIKDSLFELEAKFKVRYQCPFMFRCKWNISEPSSFVVVSSPHACRTHQLVPTSSILSLSIQSLSVYSISTCRNSIVVIVFWTRKGLELGNMASDPH